MYQTQGNKKKWKKEITRKKGKSKEQWYLREKVKKKEQGTERKE